MDRNRVDARTKKVHFYQLKFENFKIYSIFITFILVWTHCCRQKRVGRRLRTEFALISWSWFKLRRGGVDLWISARVWSFIGSSLLLLMTFGLGFFTFMRILNHTEGNVHKADLEISRVFSSKNRSKRHFQYFDVIFVGFALFSTHCSVSTLRYQIGRSSRRTGTGDLRLFSLISNFLFCILFFDQKTNPSSKSVKPWQMMSFNVPMTMWPDCSIILFKRLSMSWSETQSTTIYGKFLSWKSNIPRLFIGRS